MTGTLPTTALLDGWRRKTLLVGGLGTLLALPGLFLRPERFFPAYLYAYLFWLGIALGSLAIAMLHHLTGGGWGFVIRRILEAAFGTLPLLALLFVPLLFGLHRLYPWADAARVAADPLLRDKHGMFALPFFLARSAVYFAVWIFLARRLRNWSLRQDQTADPALTGRFQRGCGPGLALYVGTVSLAAIDWVMSLEPRWYSTIFGMLLITGQALTALAFAIGIANRIVGLSGTEERRKEAEKEQDPLRRLLASAAKRSRRHAQDKNLTANTHPPCLAEGPTLEMQLAPFRQDLGGMLLAFVLLWVYMGYSQYIVIWSGDLPSENVFYLHRQAGGWKLLAWGLIVLHFALPFVLLLFGGLKRRAGILSGIASLLLLCHLIYDFWLVAPTFRPEGFGLSWLDIVLPFALGGWWLAVFCIGLQSAALLPLHDPRLADPEAAADLTRAREELENG